MKRLLLMLTVGAMLLALMSCGGQNNKPDEKTYTDNYVYTMWRTPDTAVSTLYRINVISAVGVPVCPDPLCGHDTSACPFYGINTAGSDIVGSSIYYLRDSVPMRYSRQVCRFDLERGKTLAIVGESGSGKSVTSKAILGILAGNSIVESGEILYDGKDLLKISEQEMCGIRGDSISMIFQDPLSSLNPIVKIGKQITEAMLLKNKTSRKEARNDFNGLLAELSRHMAAATGDEAKAKSMCATFDKFCIEANKLEQSYNNCASFAQDMVASIEDLLFKTEKHQKMDARGLMADYQSKLKHLTDPFFTARYKDALAKVSSGLDAARSQVKSGGVTELPESVSAALHELEDLLRAMVE